MGDSIEYARRRFGEQLAANRRGAILGAVGIFVTVALLAFLLPQEESGQEIRALMIGAGATLAVSIAGLLVLFVFDLLRAPTILARQAGATADAARARAEVERDEALELLRIARAPIVTKQAFQRLHDEGTAVVALGFSETDDLTAAISEFDNWFGRCVELTEAEAPAYLIKLREAIVLPPPVSFGFANDRPMRTIERSETSKYTMRIDSIRAVLREIIES